MSRITKTISGSSYTGYDEALTDCKNQLINLLKSNVTFDFGKISITFNEDNNSSHNGFIKIGLEFEEKTINLGTKFSTVAKATLVGNNQSIFSKDTKIDLFTNSDDGSWLLFGGGNNNVLYSPNAISYTNLALGVVYIKQKPYIVVQVSNVLQFYSFENTSGEPDLYVNFNNAYYAPYLNGVYNSNGIIMIPQFLSETINTKCYFSDKYSPTLMQINNSSLVNSVAYKIDSANYVCIKQVGDTSMTSFLAARYSDD